MQAAAGTRSGGIARAAGVRPGHAGRAGAGVARGRRPGRLARFTSLALALAGSLSPAAARSPLPYRVEVEVGYGVPAGPQSVRGEIEAAVRQDLAQRRCFRAVGAAPAAPFEEDLVLRLTIEEFVEEASYGTTLHERSRSHDPEVAQAADARASAIVSLELRTATDSLSLRTRRYREEALASGMASADPSALARELFLAQLVRQARKFACTGSPAAWQKLLRRAREAARASAR